MVLPNTVEMIDEMERSSAGGTSSEVMPVDATSSDGGIQVVQNVTEEASSDDLKKALDELHSLCEVLGINYNSKLAEFGTSVDAERVQTAINFLVTTREKNFHELKRISKEMMTEWKLSKTPFKRMCPFAWIIYIVDASDADLLSAKNLLSTDWVNKARREVVSLKKERDDGIKRRYSTKSNKLRDLLKGAHLTYNDIQYSPKKQVQVQDLKAEIQNLKQIIKRAKPIASQRTELVLRVELVRKAKSMQELEVLISNAKSSAEILETDDEPVLYDGRSVYDVLNMYRAHFTKTAAEKAEKNAKGLPTDTNLPTGRTRKGTRYKIRDSDAREERAPRVAREDTVDVDSSDDGADGRE